MADLMCLESIVESRARLDPVIFRDPRILDNMLANESASVVVEDYFETTQKDNNIRPFMRSDIVVWMMEVGAGAPSWAPMLLNGWLMVGPTFRHGGRRWWGPSRLFCSKATRSGPPPPGAARRHRAHATPRAGPLWG